MKHPLDALRTDRLGSGMPADVRGPGLSPDPTGKPSRPTQEEQSRGFYNAGNRRWGTPDEAFPTRLTRAISQAATDGKGVIVPKDEVPYSFSLGTNLLSDPENFDPSISAWFVRDNPTITRNQAITPQGSNAADAFAGDADAQTDGVRQTLAVADDSEDYVFSVYTKKINGAIGFLELRFFGGPTTISEQLKFDLDKDPVIQTTTSNILASDEEELDNGWWRIQFTVANNGTGHTSCRVDIMADDGGTTNKRLYYWGALLEKASTAGTYYFFDHRVRVFRMGNLSDVFDWYAYGASGGGMTDDWQAIQSCFRAAIDPATFRARAPVYMPEGDFRIQDTVRVRTVEGLIVRGAGGGFRPATNLKADLSDNTKHLFDVSDTRRCVWSDFGVNPNTNSGIDAVFRSANESTGVIPTSCHYENIRIEGDGVNPSRGWFFDGGGAGGNANNDLNIFISCFVQNPAEEGWLIDHNQSKTHTLLHSSANGGKHIIRSSGSYRFIGGAGGGSTSQAAFRQESNVDNILIQGFNLEGCDRLFERGGPSSSIFPVSIRDGRFNTNGLNADGKVIIYKSAGPLIVEGVLFSPDAVVIETDTSLAGLRARISHNGFVGNGEGNTPWGSLAEGDGEYEIVGNHFGNGGSAQRTIFPDGDTTPSVFGGTIFRTQNTNTTMITDLDDEHYRQRVTILVEDNNTQFQHGSGLVLQGATNWTGAESGDSITFCYDAISWRETHRSVNSSLESDLGTVNTNQALDADAFLRYKATLSGNVQFGISGGSAGDTVVLEITQDGTGGRNVTWDTDIEWEGGSAPSETTTAGATDTWVFHVMADGGPYVGQLFAADHS